MLKLCSEISRPSSLTVFFSFLSMICSIFSTLTRIILICAQFKKYFSVSLSVCDCWDVIFVNACLPTLSLSLYLGASEEGKIKRMMLLERWWGVAISLGRLLLVCAHTGFESSVRRKVLFCPNIWFCVWKIFSSRKGLVLRFFGSQRRVCIARHPLDSPGWYVGFGHA